MPPPLIHLHVQRFADLDHTRRQHWLDLLTPDDKAGLAQHPDVRSRQALARGWLRELLGLALHCAPTQIPLRRTPHGKPCLPGNTLGFNVSHSRGAMAIAWSHAPLPVGVDIEDLERDLQMSLLASRKFSPAERKAWEDTGNSRQQWLATWTRKEALLKAHGMGIRIDLSGVDTLSPEQPRGQVRHPELGRWQWRTWSDGQQLLSLAWADAPAQVQFHTDAPWSDIS